MNQTSNSASSRGDRPQLFRTPTAADRHIDFGPSILATIDGGASRSSAPASRFPRRGLLWLAGLALLLAVAYAVASIRGVPLSADSLYAMFSKPKASAELVPAAKVAVKPASPAASAIASASGVEQGAASIETVALPVPLAAVAASAPFAVLASAEPAASAVAGGPEGEANSSAMKAEAVKPIPAKSAPVEASPHRHAIKKKEETHVAKVRSSAKPAVAKPSAAPAQDNDAELLAAMLPHLHSQRQAVAAPTSPAYEKRCGLLSGEAASACRLKFCNGREGTDAACPAPRVP
jgi:hypothetical protein